MKMYYEKKDKLANQRLKIMREYFNKNDEGSKIFLTDTSCSNESDGYYILSAHEIDNEFYYVLGGKDGSIFVAKIIYNGQVRVTKVTKKSRKYKENKNMFDLWIKEVRDTRERRIRECYDELSELHNGNIFPHRMIIYDNNNNVIHAKLSLTKQYNNQYYCVVKLSNGNYMVTKIAWYNGCVREIVVADKEVKTNKSEFDSWIFEAKKKASLHN